MSQKISICEEIYPHEYLWRAADLMLKEAKSKEEKSYYFLLSALLMSYMAFDAFVNFSGFVLFPEIWDDERKHFKGKDDSIEAKISKLLKKLPDFEWRKGGRPYQTIRKLRAFRDIVAHGKVVLSNYDAISEGDWIHIKWEHDWDTFISIEKVESSMHDIKSFCQSLVESMRKRSDHLHLAFSAFEGARASAEGRPPNRSR